MKTKHMLIAILLSGFGALAAAQANPSSDQMRNETRAEQRELSQKKHQAHADKKRLNRAHLRMKDVGAKAAQ